MTWVGVGNVEGLLFRRNRQASPEHESLLLRSGVLGYRLPPLEQTVIPTDHGDTLILVTDGIRSGFADGLNLTHPPQRIAGNILAEHSRGTDDALVFVARYLGRSS